MLNKLKKKEKTAHSTFSNTMYMLKIMFEISPMLVIGEIVQHIITIMPSRLVSVIGLKFIIDEVQGDSNPKKIVFGIILMVVLIVVADVSTSLFFELFAHREREKIDLGIQSKLYKKAAELDLKKYDDPNYYADFILAIENASNSIRYGLAMVRSWIGELVSFIAMATIIMTIDPICLIIILAFVVVFIPMGRYTGTLQIKRREAMTEKHRKGDYFARIFYLPDYAGEVRTSGIYPLLRKRFNESADEVVLTQKSFMKKLTALFGIQDFTVQGIGFMLVLSLYIGYQTLVTNKLSASDFIATFNGAINIGNGILFLTVYGIRNFTEHAKLIEKCRTFLAETSDIKDGEHIAECGDPETISVKNITFSYEGSEKDCINGVSFEIKPYEKIALVGYNGAGKTTLTNLLLRLYDVNSGSIEIGGRDIREETVDSHRTRFAAVFQDFQIFGATVGENVAMSTTFDEERVLKALEVAGFDKELPNGVNTVLLREFDDEGTMLSGGEQQKLAIARVFYKQCPYIILDEPSANLDPISEYELNKAISESCEDRTVVFISHRLSTTRHADRILMLENGQIIESGSHDELMELDGKYAYMFRLQAEKYTENQAV